MHGQGVVDHLREGEFTLFQSQLLGLHLGDVDDVVDDDEQMLGRLPALVEPVDLLWIGGTAQHQIGHTHYAIHRRAQFVAHGGEKDALGAVGGLCGVSGLR